MTKPREVVVKITVRTDEHLADMLRVLRLVFMEEDGRESWVERDGGPNDEWDKITGISVSEIESSDTKDW